jgi:hypothetical protein
MNVFEDLIGELKDENLIEQTVIETSRAETDFKVSKHKVIEVETVLAAQSASLAESAALEPPRRTAENPAEVISLDGSRSSVNEADFYRKRAMEEVAFLQMVEAVMANVEREHLKVVPEPYDDWEVKKVLHSFIQVSQDVNSPEHLQAHFQLLQETENWHSTLARRDERVMTANLRRYCEMSRPPLSSPALTALARFYRNSSFSESVRGKFDLIVTRLFSKEVGSRREMTFSRRELAVQIAKLYADWSSVPLYSTEKDDFQISQTAREFEEFIKEADESESFDELIDGNFFNRLRIFKESANEDFYAPLVAAAGVEVNVRVGNRCVELLEKERENGSAAKLEEKYGFTRDDEISEVTGKTLLLTEILKRKAAAPKRFVPKPHREKIASENAAAATKIESKPHREISGKANSATENNLFGVNRWLLAATILAVVVSLGLYFWAA